MWQFQMTAYAGSKHERGVRAGTEIIRVVHSDLTTAQTEMLAFEARMARGAVNHVDVIDMRENPNENLTQVHVCVGDRWRGMAGVENHHGV